MREDQVVLVAVGVAAVVAIAVLVLASRRTTAVRQLLVDLATAAGWTNQRNVFLAASGVKGTWRSFPVSLSYHARQKGVPQRLILKVRAQTDARLIVKRKFEGLLSNRPLTWFGPPLVDVHQPAAAELWVRSDEAASAERIFSDADVVKKIADNVVARFDEIRVDRNGLRITRAIDEQAVRKKYGFEFTIAFDPKRYETIAGEELALADALVSRLSMMA
jgi:hypothetical protein